MKAAVIGLGRVGYEFGLDKKRKQPASHLACYLRLFSDNAIGVCDNNGDLLNEFAHEYMPTAGYFCEDYRELIGEFEPNFISICTPTPTHKEIVLEACKYDFVKGILLEKPIAQNIKDAKTIITACKQNNTKLSVNYTRRWNPVYRGLDLCCFDTAVGLHPGPILRTGTHMIDVFNMTFGIPETVQAFDARLNYLTEQKEGCDDYSISGKICYPLATAYLISGKHRPKTVLFEIDLWGQLQRRRIVENGNKEYMYELLPSGQYEELKEYQVVFTRIGRQRDVTPLMSAVELLVHGLENYCSGEDALQTLRVALGLHLSHDQKREIHLDDVPEDYEVVTY